MSDNRAPESSYTLYVYYTRYSSWGARAQLVLEYFQIPYRVQYFNYTNPALTPPPELTVLPVLDVAGDDDVAGAEDTPLRIADSLAICELLAERHQDRALWPRDTRLRALARVAAAQMHSGFAALRDAYPCNFVSRFEGPGVPRGGEAVARDLAKLFSLWSRTRAAARKRLAQLGEADEGFLCGGFSIADAFFWPVLWRLRSYSVPLTGLDEDGVKWMETMWNHPVMKAQGREYFRQAQDPQTQMLPYDDVFKNTPGVESGKFTEDWSFKGPSP
ncbi:putative glutathione S transferase [Xylaria palmicola]|nr:putative glutathione S transferase [Xylaria palmicola]